MGTMIESHKATIEDAGSNTNGSYIRFSDGTQICWWDSPGGSNPVTWTYPKPFISQPLVTFSTRSTGSWPIIWNLDRNTNSGLPTTTSVTVYGWYWDDVAGNFSSGTGAEVHFFAIGKWK